MLKPNDKKKFLEELERMPFPSIACQRAGISKATIYRWRDNNSAFKKQMDAAIEVGRETITESAEAHTVGLIKKGDFRAIRLWLENNTTRYYKPKKAIAAPRTERIINTVKVQIVGADGKPMNARPAREEEHKIPPLVVLKKRKPTG